MAMMESTQHHNMLRRANRTTNARLLSCAGPLAGAWLTAPLKGLASKFTDEEFEMAVRLRVGLPPSDHLPAACRCGRRRAFHNDPWHGLSCHLLKRREINWRHNDVVHIVAATTRSLGAFAHIEPSRIDNARIRPDLLLRIGRRRIMVDVAVVHPGAPSRLRAAQRSLGTALQQQRIKHARYDRLARTEHSIFLPFIVETFGATAPEARSVMREIASFAGRLIPSQTRHATLVRLMTQISVAVQRGNAQAVLACIQDG